MTTVVSCFLGNCDCDCDCVCVCVRARARAHTFMCMPKLRLCDHVEVRRMPCILLIIVGHRVHFTHFINLLAGGEFGNSTLSKVEFVLEPGESVYVILNGAGSMGYTCGVIGKRLFFCRAAGVCSGLSLACHNQPL